ncbi:hypothetical protein E2C01_044339 [Portunus trituberculatus]|uniref:Uncharacterized protein n=1 Tax=Portunus trituberculatus TaxID=210409 RepID=A0A5B7FRV1_PORTR|nr:hypothetical protein [Portunus trituberculatus]
MLKPSKASQLSHSDSSQVGVKASVRQESWCRHAGGASALRDPSGPRHLHGLEQLYCKLGESGKDKRQPEPRCLVDRKVQDANSLSDGGRKDVTASAGDCAALRNTPAI